MADKIEIDVLATDNFSTTFKRLNGQLVQTRAKQTFFDRGMKSSRTVITNYAQGAKKATGAMGGLQGALGGAITRFIGITAVIGLTTKAVQALVQWVGESIKEFREFEKNMAEVSTIMTGDAIKGFAEVGVEIERLSLTYGKSANDLAQGMYDILSAAFEAQEGMRLLETATKASIAGITDVQTAVDVFTSILNAWGKSVAQATSISDQLFQTVVRGKLKFEDLASSMGYIAPIAANLGVEFKEIAAALSTVTRQGQHVDMATRGLALMLQNIADLAPAAADATIKYGVDLSDVALRVGGLEYIIKDLNSAMKEHGAQILPEMIRNMRSLRVAMALAGDEGVKGFTTDLELLGNASGRTEEAMAKMMNIAQQEADMLDQSMKYLERDIGEAWSGFDIWVKKAKLWWGSLLAGKDADAAVDAYEERANKIKISAYEVIKTAEQMKDRTPLSEIMADVDLSQYDKLTTKIETMKDTVAKEFDFGNVKEFFKISDEIADKADFAFLLKKSKMGAEALKAEWDNLVIKYGIGSVPEQEITRMNQKAMEAGIGGIDFSKITSKDISLGGFLDFLGGAFSDLFSSFENLMEHGSKAIDSVKVSLGAKQLANLIEGLTESSQEYEDELGILKERQSILANSEQKFTEAIDDADEAIQTHKENILTLQRALEELNEDITDNYETISGKRFAGKDYWKITSAGMETAMDRFTRYSQQVIKYGGQMKTDYMDRIKDMVNDYENVDKAQLNTLGSLEWYNEEIFNSIDGIEEFDGDMIKVIESIGDYNVQLKEAKKIQAEYTEELDASQKKMLELSLQMQKIQLKGMSRRRGLTRMEEKMVQKIRIKQTKERIKQMEWELEEKERIDELGIVALEESVNNAMSIYEEYNDKVKWALADMKDVQDEELEKFLGIINMKEERVIRYHEMYQKEILNLENSIANHQALMAIIATDPVLDESYRAMYGLDALEEAQRQMEAYQKFISEYNITDAAPGGFAKISVTPDEGALVDTKGDDDDTTPVATTPQTSYNYVKPQSKGAQAHEWMEKNWGAASAITKPLDDLGSVIVGGFKSLFGLQRGTYSVGAEGLYKLHKGEQVIPPGGARAAGAGGGDVFNISINVNATVGNDYDVTRLAAQLGDAMERGVLNKKGKSSYRLR
jgi:TP901 family phage tail tape measure protein